MAYPLPNITDIFDQAGNANYYVILDYVSGSHQILLAEESIPLTAFFIQKWSL